MAYDDIRLILEYDGRQHAEDTQPVAHRHLPARGTGPDSLATGDHHLRWHLSRTIADPRTSTRRPAERAGRWVSARTFKPEWRLLLPDPLALAAELWGAAPPADGATHVTLPIGLWAPGSPGS